MCLIYTFGIFFKLFDSIPMHLRLCYLIQTSETIAILTGLLTSYVPLPQKKNLLKI